MEQSRRGGGTELAVRRSSVPALEASVGVFFQSPLCRQGRGQGSVVLRQKPACIFCLLMIIEGAIQLTGGGGSGVFLELEQGWVVLKT